MAETNYGASNSTLERYNFVGDACGWWLLSVVCRPWTRAITLSLLDRLGKKEPEWFKVNCSGLWIDFVKAKLYY